MSERKCLSKYEKIKGQYQKIFNSIDIPKKQKVRFMLPLDIKCAKCCVKIKKGKKLNAIKEKILNKKYYGMNFLRFYFRCSKCLSGSSITTDLHELKYVTEINCQEI